MKAIYLTGPNAFSYQEVEPPAAGRDDVLIRVRMAGICGSDVHLLRGRNPFAAYPLVPGHEYMGEVVSAPKKSGFKPGDKVTGFPETACGKCAACRAGKLIHCPEFRFVGVRVPGGCFGEIVSVPAWRVIRLPKAMDEEQGAMVEPTAVAYHANKRAGVRKGDRVVVIGGGTIGLLTAQVARTMGAGKVVISEPIPERRRIAEKLGFRLLCNPVEQELPAFVSERIGAADIVFDVVTSEKTLENSQSMLRPDGTLVLVGLPHHAGLGVPYQPIFAKELKVVGSRTYFMSDFPAAIRLISSGKVKVKPIISGVLPLEQFLEGLERLEKEPERYVKILVQP
ncbi:MAG TPA: alcohol dehydrogenase catalytic domain-containing protein [Thermodesulfobacteriota bacterium]|nr:alcohol dehydrogenase catalytic domain-containing protein [Thermodesulfobacteriota bacterium]